MTAEACLLSPPLLLAPDEGLSPILLCSLRELASPVAMSFA